MRSNLIKHKKDRLEFTATVGRFGTKRNYHGYPQNTVCFIDVFFKDGKKATDHLWMTVGETIEKLYLKSGDYVSFHARVDTYRKGYYNEQLDYTLKNISKLQKL